MGDIDDRSSLLLLMGTVQRAKVVQQQLKQRKKMKGCVDRSEDEDGSATDTAANEPRQFTVYVQVYTASPDSCKPAGKSAKVPAMKIISKGPFKCDTAAAFYSFKSRVAKALPCWVSALPVSKFEWKFENQAQGAPRKKVADESGYEALLDAVKAKRLHENVVVWLYTPTPKKVEEVQFSCVTLCSLMPSNLQFQQDWDMGDADYVDQPFDVNNELDTRQSNGKACLVCVQTNTCWHCELTTISGQHGQQGESCSS